MNWLFVISCGLIITDLRRPAFRAKSYRGRMMAGDQSAPKSR